MLVIPAFKACMQSALIRANIKPPVELVVANLNKSKNKGVPKSIFWDTFLHIQIFYEYAAQVKKECIRKARK